MVPGDTEEGKLFLSWRVQGVKEQAGTRRWMRREVFREPAGTGSKRVNRYPEARPNGSFTQSKKYSSTIRSTVRISSGCELVSNVIIKSIDGIIPLEI